ncbi:hypothetical protein MMA231_02195 [Asticcacaulis sp. MM231]|uniref:hypothetical protein n=1 Tax=Asticcacaulis sp. MM231 TaxID=3157666 RepID=UPI0032D5756E
MSKERKISIAKALTAQLHATEEAIDTALAEAANLIEAYVTSRRTIRISTIVGNDVHYNTLQAMMSLSTAQRHMTAAHADLTKVQHQVGLGAVDIVPVDDKPSPKPTGAMPARENETA